MASYPRPQVRNARLAVKDEICDNDISNEHDSAFRSGVSGNLLLPHPSRIDRD